MIRFFVVLSSVLLLGALAAACALDEQGVAPNDGRFDGSVDKVSHSDAGNTNSWGLEGGPEAPPPPGGFCPKADAAACAVPEGWTPVSFTTTPTDACPTGYKQIDGVTGPFSGNVPCSSCTLPQAPCTIESPPTCAAGTLTQIGFDSELTPSTPCGGTANDITFTAGASFCNALPDGLTQTRHLKAGAPAASGGSCTFGVMSTTSVRGTSARVCLPKDESCAGELCSSKKECVAHDGAVPCPSGTPYTKASVVGDEVGANCSACGSCRVDGKCSGTLTFYANDGCTGDGDAVPIPVSRSCNAVAREIDNETYRSVGYVGAKPEQVTCVATGGGNAPLLAKTNVHTICCR